MGIARSAAINVGMLYVVAMLVVALTFIFALFFNYLQTSLGLTEIPNLFELFFEASWGITIFFIAVPLGLGIWVTGLILDVFAPIIFEGINSIMIFFNLPAIFPTWTPVSADWLAQINQLTAFINSLKPTITPAA